MYTSGARSSTFRSFRRILLGIVLLLPGGPWSPVAGCAHRRAGEPQVHLPRMVFDRPPGWEVVRRVRWIGVQRVVLGSPGGGATLSVALLYTRPRLREIPLDLLAEILVGDSGRDRGIVTEARTRHEVVLAGRRAIALTGTRSHGPRELGFSSLVARVDRRVLVVELLAAPASLGSHAMAVERIMNSLRLPLDPAPEARYGEW